MLLLFLALSAVPASFVGILLINEASNMADDSEENIKDLGDNVTTITEESLKSEAESYMIYKLNETTNKVSAYLNERKSDCIYLANVTRTEEAFLGFYQTIGTYVKIAYINSSGYENITIENGQITTNNTNLLNGTVYFKEARKLPQEQVYIDNAELQDPTSKHVIRYSANASDGIVLVELNISIVVDIANSISLRGMSGVSLFSTAWATGLSDLKLVVISNPFTPLNITPYETLNFGNPDDLERLFPGVGFDAAEFDVDSILAGNKTMFLYLPSTVAFFGNETSGYVAVGVIGEDKFMVAIFATTDTFLGPATETNTVIEESLSDSIDDMQSSRDNMLITSIIVIATSIGLAVVGALVVGKRLTKRLKDLTKTAIRINKGDIDVEVPHRGKDEIGQLAEAFKGLQDGMKYLMQEK